MRITVDHLLLFALIFLIIKYSLLASFIYFGMFKRVKRKKEKEYFTGHGVPLDDSKSLTSLENSGSLPYIYCLMVTGKDDSRILYAKSAVQNFMAQDYPNKRLVIINHHESETKVLDESNAYCVEVCLKKTSLGHLRNVSLEFVPMNALWTIWDDDDWRPDHYLYTLFKWLSTNRVDCVTYTTRYEFNLQTSFSWRMTLMKGYPTVLCRKNPLIKYKNDADTMEDIDLVQDIQRIGLKLKVVHNEDRPDMYVRLVHRDNTSLYVNPVKDRVRMRRPGQVYGYKEDNIDEDEKKFVESRVGEILGEKKKATKFEVSMKL